MKQQELCHGGAFGNALIIMHITLVTGENIGNSHLFGAKWHRIGAFDQRRRGSPSVPGASAEKNLGDRLPHLTPTGSPGSVPTTAIFPIPPAGKTGTKYPDRELAPFPDPTHNHAESKVSPAMAWHPSPHPTPSHAASTARTVCVANVPPSQRAEQTVWAVRTTKHDAGCRVSGVGCRVSGVGCRVSECCV